MVQDYEFYDSVWHWMDPITLINNKHPCAVEACILIETGFLVVTVGVGRYDLKWKKAVSQNSKSTNHMQFCLHLHPALLLQYW